ncbi:hypothetical protein [Streptomyces sp. AC495_CC817]|uniref:hypothetical protein n=1 Tax=Streptomyces sp. AC495_CC817 TaxID=2823900 RepID=UPI001C272B85|nr:hypothetical protein [Streptomyces sp. AC495_CC817]
MADDLASWLRVLERFERALDVVDEPEAAEAFTPPAGPIPEELRARAEALLARQQLMISGLTATRANVARELAALRRVPSAESRTPAYLDVEG